MDQQRPPTVPRRWEKTILRSRYFVVAVLIHVLLFLLIATVVIWQAPTPPGDTFKRVTIQVPPPPPPLSQAPAAGDAALNPQLEPQPVVVPVITPPSVITTMNSDLTETAPKATDAALSHLPKLPQGSGLTSGSGNTGSGAGNGLFGSFTGGDNSLQGTIYDLKINPSHKPTGMDTTTYTGLLQNFVAKGWDESVLAPYYKASKKLFTTAVWIPTTKSEECAEKMRLDSELSPNYWVGWYHAKVTPAQAGKYHFVGFGDDILAVAVNGQIVFDGSLLPVTSGAQTIPWSYQDWCVTNPYRDANYAKLRVGRTFEVNGVEQVTIDILMGDEPGSYYCAYLLIADESKQYPTDSHGVPLYPIFQIGSDAVLRSGDQPPHATGPVSWSAP